MAKVDTRADRKRSGHRWKAKLTLLTLTFLLTIAQSATAGVVTYTLVGVTFTDGGTATGYVKADYNQSPAAVVDYQITVVDTNYPDQPLVFAPSKGTQVFNIRGSLGESWGFYNGTPPGTQPPNANDDAITLGVPPSVFTGPPPNTPVPLGPINVSWQNSTLEKVVKSNYAFFANGTGGSFAPVLPAALLISTTSLPSGTAGQPYSAQLTAVGGTAPYTWSVAPVGNPAISPLDASKLSLDTSMGIISSSRIYGGNNSFTVIVQDAMGASANKDLTINTPCGFSKQDYTFSRLLPFAQYLASDAPGSFVPLQFGFQPTPNTAGYSLCNTAASGCTLTMAAGMLATISGGDNVAANATPAWLNSRFISSPLFVAYGTGYLRDGTPDWCEFTGSTWAIHLPRVDNYNVSLETAGPLPIDFSSLDDFLEAKICETNQAVILKLQHADSGRAHFVLGTGRIIDPASKIPDWQLFDGGQNPSNTSDTASGPSPALNQYSLRGHLTGFYWRPNGTPPAKFLQYTLSGSESRVYAATNTPGSIVVSAGSPVELLITDPLGRQVGNSGTGADIVTIPGGSYFRDGLLEDDSQGGPTTTSTTTDKTAYINNAIAGNYLVDVVGTGLGTYTLTYTALATDHTIQTSFALGTANSGTITRFAFQYLNSPTTINSMVPVASFASTLADIDNGLQLGMVGDQGIANSLSQKIEAAQKSSGPQRMNILNAFQNEITAQSGKQLTGILPNVLLQDVASLINQN